MRRRLAFHAAILAQWLIRLVVTVAFLVVVSDAAVRLWYEYAPVRLFVDFRSVSVAERDGRPYLLFERRAARTYEASYNRGLLTMVGNLQICGKTAPGFFPIEPDDDDVVELPLQFALHEACGDMLGDRTMVVRLRMTLTILLPYNTRRIQERVSQPFVIWVEDGRLRVKAYL